MSRIAINDLNTDTFLYTLAEAESLSIMGGRPPVHERWWFKALVKVATGVLIGVLVDEFTD